MITEWAYSNDVYSSRDKVKKIILNNNYKSIDIGASADFWSYPECKIVADSMDNYKPDVQQFKINLENKQDYLKIKEYVDINGKFDFSICSHTLEDIFNPIDLIEFIPTISNRGFIAIPSKYDELCYLYQNKHLGNAHHKTILDIIDNTLVLFPKYPFIEISPRTQEIRNNHKGKELYFYWQGTIPYRVFGNGIPFIGDDALINAFFNELKG